MQSGFLRALGCAIANSLWQVALLWLFVVLINSIRKLSSAQKYFASVTAQFAAFAWFIATFQFYYNRSGNGLLDTPLTNAANTGAAYLAVPVADSFSSTVLYLVIKTESVLPYLSIAYLVMLVFLCIRFSRAFYYTKKIRTTGLKKAGVELRLFVKRTAANLGIKKEVSIYFSSIVKGPLTVGFLKPLILVPIASINHLTTEQLEAVLLHELAHIKRADYLINILQAVVETILFFNPFVQLIGKFIKQERENSCDDWVLQFQYDAAMYAGALLRIAYIQNGSPVLAMNAGGSKEGELLPRVKRMLNQQEKTHRYRNQVFALFLITIMLSTVAWLQPVVKNSSTANTTKLNTGDTKKTFAEPLVSGVDNPLFNPMFFLTEPIQKEIDKAINIAQQKIVESTPAIEQVTNNIFTNIAPAALEQLNKITPRLNDSFADTDANANVDKNEDEKNNDSITDFNFPDSVNFANAFTGAILNEINNSDWKKVTEEIKKAQLQLEATQKDNGLVNLTSSIVSLALNATISQLKKIKFTGAYLQKQQDALSLKQTELKKIEADKLKLKEASLSIEKVFKQREKEREKWIEEKLDKLFTDPASKQNSEEDKIVSFTDEQNINYPVAPEIYSAAAYNYPPGVNVSGIDSAIIIVKHNAANQNSYTKYITVEITGNNGEKKTYEFTVKVYQ